MVERESLKQSIDSLRARIVSLRDSLDLPARQAEMADLETRMGVPGFWNNQEAAQAVVAKLKAAKGVVTPVQEISRGVEDLETLHELAEEDGGDDTFAEIAREVERIEGDLDRLELRTMLSGPHDAGNCYFAIHAGAGGTESCDWAEMLLRMYLRYFERNGYKAQEVDRLDGEEAGIRSATLYVTGPCAYGYLSCERGVHRLVRISPYDSQSRRHTSFASVDVIPEMEDIDIDIDWEKDVREDTFCASGAGGQHVNKTASAVRLVHKPTGIVVQCQNERSQHKNRAEARKMLAAKLYQNEQAKRDAELAKMYGEKGEIAFGNQIRSYVLYPYQLVRDERTELKSPHTDRILDGEIQEFIDAYLRHRASAKKR
ncbi:MAG TPA: peptide chain release factor 2 [Phycisphaerales bacterium]|nr:peptide chain release factor 2 [Phycisphaerales bacterium]